MKTCASCLECKPFSEFYERQDSPDGCRNDCKSCTKARVRSRRHFDLEASREYDRRLYRKKVKANPNWGAEHYAATKETQREYNQANYTRHRDKRIKAAVEWARQNKSKANANKRAYKAAKIQAFPIWVREDIDLVWLIHEAYDLAEMRSRDTGFQWHVDHIVPLRGELVCGLHAPWNLQVIPGADNCRKGNKFVGESRYGTGNC